MYQRIAHIYDVSPRHIWMPLAKNLCQQIGSFTYNHDIIDHSMKAHYIGFHVLEGLPPKIVIDVHYALINMPKTVYVSNIFSHKLLLSHD